MMDVSEIESKTVYDLLIAFSSYTELKRKILLCLAHIYPQAVSGTQLAKMIGYSGKARTLYRGVLERMQEDNVILLDKLTPKLFSIRINHKHNLMKGLILLVEPHGKELKEKFLKISETNMEIEENE